MTSFVDELRSTPNLRLCETLRALKLMSLQDSVNAREVAELNDEFRESLAVDDLPIMSHFRVSSDLLRLAEGFTPEQALAAYRCWQPLAPVYSFEVAGVCAFVMSDETIILCGRHRDGHLIWAFGYQIQGGGLMKVHWEFNSELSQETPEDRAEGAETLLQIIALTSAIIAIPGACAVQTRTPPERLQAARERRRKPRLVEYVEYGVDRPKAPVGGTESMGGHANLPLHQVIGHFRLLTRGREAPRLSFVSPHWRGRLANGIRLKNYSIGGSGLAFNPPIDALPETGVRHERTA